ncbi:acyl-CoA thioester hydrolase/BAAT C-terminal domain-containing protein [Pseudidiomarina insulisalsae]|nr:acyl-CoA thioester hydrolase/BAAT C-terminal domain-containing protein [Pseudidiomarina insulisalsae]
MKAKILASLLAALALSGCNEPGYPEHLQVSKVDHEGLQGVLVTPKTEAPLTTVIVVGGSDGGVQSAVATAQVLADQGLAALAVGYFGMPRLPAQLSEIPLEYFSAAVDYIDASPQLQRNQCQQVGVVGSSRGAELALLLGSHNSDFAPVVGIAPSSHSWGAIGDSSKAAWTYAGRPLAYLQRHSQPDYEVDRFIGRPYFVEDLQHSDAAQAEIDATKITGEVVLVAGEDDQLWPAAEMAETLLQQFADANEQSRITVLTYAGAGHVIAPGTPVNLSEVELPSGQTLVLGGNAKANRSAQEHALPHIVATLKDPVCRAQPQAHGFDPEQLSALSDFVATTGTSSMVLMSDSKIVFEYGDIHEAHTIHSFRKAMLNSLYGIYVERGVIDLDATLAELGIDDLSPLSELEKTATVRQLLQSRSGIYHPAAATSAGMLAQLPRASEPVSWQYVCLQ